MSAADKITHLEKMIFELKQQQSTDDSGPVTPQMLKGMETRISARIKSSEQSTSAELEEQGVAFSFILIGVTVFCAYFFTQVIIEQMNRWRCHCNPRDAEWKLLVEASRFTLLNVPTNLPAAAPAAASSCGVGCVG